MQLTGADVVKYLTGHKTVRDGSLVNFNVRDVHENAVVDLEFEVPHGDDIRRVKLELREIQEFNYGYSIEHSAVVEFLKCLTTETGDFYLSLDPYEEWDPLPSDKDNDYFSAKSVTLTENSAGGMP